MNPWRLLTYLLAAIAGCLAVAKPNYAAVLVPVSTTLAGWASPHPADTKTEEKK
jgi:hypothetical protein